MTKSLLGRRNMKIGPQILGPDFGQFLSPFLTPKSCYRSRFFVVYTSPRFGWNFCRHGMNIFDQNDPQNWPHFLTIFWAFFESRSKNPYLLGWLLAFWKRAFPMAEFAMGGRNFCYFRLRPSRHDHENFRNTHFFVFGDFDEVDFWPPPQNLGVGDLDFGKSGGREGPRKVALGGHFWGPKSGSGGPFLGGQKDPWKGPFRG